MPFKTKLEALYATRNHWQWLAITGNQYKTDYAPARKWRLCCACCDFTGTSWTNKCKSGGACPLASFAWGTNRYACEDEGTCYALWLHCDLVRGKKYYASRMVYACNLAIEAELLKDINL